MGASSSHFTDAVRGGTLYELFVSDAGSAPMTVPHRVVIVRHSSTMGRAETVCIDDPHVLAHVVATYRESRVHLHYEPLDVASANDDDGDDDDEASHESSAHAAVRVLNQCAHRERRCDPRAIEVRMYDTADARWPRVYCIGPHGGHTLDPPPPSPRSMYFTSQGSPTATPSESMTTVSDNARWWWSTVSAATTSAVVNASHAFWNSMALLVRCTYVVPRDDAHAKPTWPLFELLVALAETSTRATVHCALIPTLEDTMTPAQVAAMLGVGMTGTTSERTDGPRLSWVLVYPSKRGHESIVCAQRCAFRASLSESTDQSAEAMVAARDLLPHIDIDAPWRALHLVPLDANDERCVQWALEHVRLRCPRATEREWDAMAMAHIRRLTAAEGERSRAYVPIDSRPIDDSRSRDGVPAVRSAALGLALNFNGDVVQRASCYIGAQLSAEARSDHVVCAPLARSEPLECATHGVVMAPGASTALSVSTSAHRSSSCGTISADEASASSASSPQYVRACRAPVHPYTTTTTPPISVSSLTTTTTTTTTTSATSRRHRHGHRHRKRRARDTRQTTATPNTTSTNSGSSRPNTMLDYGRRLLAAVDTHMIDACIAHADVDAAHAAFRTQQPYHGVHLDLYVLRAAARWLIFWGNVGFGFVALSDPLGAVSSHTSE